MISSEKKFILTVIVLLCFFLGFYLFLFSLRTGANVKAEWWLKNVYDYKDYIAARTKSPKIIILSGSNAMFGIDSYIISSITGYPVVNLALHGGLDIQFLLFELEDHLGPDDIVIMPLEDAYYTRNELSQMFTNNMLAWGEDIYLKRITAFEYLNFFLSSPSSNAFKMLLKNDQSTKFLERQEAIYKIENLLKTEGARWRGYTFLSLNQYGDIISENKITAELKKRSDEEGYLYYDVSNVSNRFLTYYRKIEKLAKDRQARLILTWSVMMKNRLFDLSNKETQMKIKDFQSILNRNSIRIYCDPKSFQFDIDSFFNTKFHLNSQGTSIRSKKLADCINQTLQ